MGFFRKSSPPVVLGVLTTPPPSSWWKTNRHLVLLGLGLAAGFWIAVHTGAAASSCTPAPGTSPRPSSTAPTLIHVPPAKGAKP
ncbi:hypothetical protein [Streptacidiphilus sp. MAP5-52]|uniref:hypothetical protein n=1 Tax=Streptacidiphilus sp. MAP5-52 TaxID=3156267 RepID=UPI00351810C1